MRKILITPAHRIDLHHERRTTHAALKDLHKANEAYRKAREKLEQEIEKADKHFSVTATMRNSGLGIDFVAERLKDNLKIRYAEITLKLKGTTVC